MRHRADLSRVLIATVLGVGLLTALLFRLDSVPPPWFDEGWAMSMARNWVELGHYGQIRNGIPVSGDMLNIGLPVIDPIALSFRLFGVGFWQGRLPSVLLTICCLCVTYSLAQRLYTRRVAVATLLVLILFSMDPWVHPLLIGRLATGEMAAALFMVLGFLALTEALEHPRGAAGAGLLMGIAAATKSQTLPFSLLALSLPFLLLLRAGKRKSASVLLAALGALIVSYSALRWLQYLLQPLHASQFSTWDLLGTTAVVFSAKARAFAGESFLWTALPAVLGQGLVLVRTRSLFQRDGPDDPRLVVQFSIALFAMSWLAWYLLLSIGWRRYLFVPVFISSLAIADMLNQYSAGFRLRQTFRDAAMAFRWPPAIPRLRALMVLLLLALMVPLSLLIVATTYFGGESSSARAVAEYVNHQTTPDALVETYEMELFVLLDRAYHYPPDQVQLDLNRRTFMGQGIPIKYDPLESDPDFLIVGPQAMMWGLYDPMILAGQFELVQSDSPYSVYKRFR